jgi:hypothetical protein
LIETEDRNLPQIHRVLAAVPLETQSIVHALLAAEQVPFGRSDPHMTRLELLGIVKEKDGRAVLRNRLYEKALHAWRLSPRETAHPAARSTIAPIRVFISYAHADEALRVELGKHLATLERQRLVASWHDRMIAPGADWTQEVDDAIENADVILLLISADFVSSRYCYDIELRRALARHTSGTAVVIPVILRPVALSGLPFEHLQSLPAELKPITEWASRDAAYVNVVEGIRDAITRLAGRHRASAVTRGRECP